MSILTITWKDLVLFVKDRGRLFMAFLLPLVFILAFGYAYSNLTTDSTRLVMLPIVDLGKLIALDTPTGLIRNLGGGLILVGLGEGQAEAVAREVASLPAVKAVTPVDTQLKVEANQVQEALMGILDATGRLDAHVTSLEILEPNLESVFLHLTGKKLRQ